MDNARSEDACALVHFTTATGGRGLARVNDLLEFGAQGECGFEFRWMCLKCQRRFYDEQRIEGLCDKEEDNLDHQLPIFSREPPKHVFEIVVRLWG